MKLRAYHPDDAPATFDVFRNAVSVTAAQHYSADQISSWLERAGGPDDWQRRMDAARIALVMEDEAGPCAFATLVTVDENTAEIHQVMCHPRRARQGAAGCLLDRLVREARTLGFKRLVTQASLSSKPLFERRGFEVSESRTILGMACFGMEKSL